MKFDIKSKKQIILLIFIILTLSLIFGLSMMPISKSLEKSNSLAETVDSLFAPELVAKPVEQNPDNTSSDTQGDTASKPPDSSTTTKPSGTSGSSSTTTKPSGTSGSSSTTTKPSGSSGSGSTTTKPSGSNTNTSASAPSTNTGSASGKNESDTSSKDNSEQSVEVVYEEKPRPIIDYIIKHIRKIAHFVEHGVLGMEVFFFLLMLERAAGKTRKILPIGVKTLLLSLNIGILVGFFDESIQLLSGRGERIKDVWIDIAGYASFTALLTVIYVIVKSIRLLIKAHLRKKRLAWDWH